MAAWLLTRIFSFFYYRGQQRKQEKELSELWDAHQAELQWLASHAADLLADVPDVLCAAIACKRLEAHLSLSKTLPEPLPETLLLQHMLQLKDAAFSSTMHCLDMAEEDPTFMQGGLILPSTLGRQKGQRAYEQRELLPLLLAIKERDSGRAEKS